MWNFVADAELRIYNVSTCRQPGAFPGSRTTVLQSFAADKSMYPLTSANHFIGPAGTDYEWISFELRLW